MFAIFWMAFAEVVTFTSGSQNAEAKTLLSPTDPNTAPQTTLQEFWNGKKADKTECDAAGNGLWLIVDGTPDCIRVFVAAGKKHSREAIVMFDGDISEVNGWKQSSGVTPKDMMKASQEWGRATGMTFAYIARPGTFGSSGIAFPTGLVVRCT